MDDFHWRRIFLQRVSLKGVLRGTDNIHVYIVAVQLDRFPKNGQYFDCKRNPTRPASLKVLLVLNEQNRGIYLIWALYIESTFTQ